MEKVMFTFQAKISEHWYNNCGLISETWAFLTNNFSSVMQMQSDRHLELSYFI